MQETPLCPAGYRQSAMRLREATKRRSFTVDGQRGQKNIHENFGWWSLDIECPRNADDWECWEESQEDVMESAVRGGGLE